MWRWREGTSVCLLLWILLLPDFGHLQITTPNTGQNGVAPLDVVICLDSSSSMGEDNYNSLKAALVNFLQQLPVSEQLIRVGVRPFSWALCEELVQLTGNATALFEGVQRLPYMRGQTRTDLAIEDAIFQLSTYGRPGVAKAIVVLTDGMPTYPTEAMAMVQRAKKLDIEMFAVGFGSLVSVTGLYSLAPEGNVYREDSFSQVPEGLLSFAKIQKEKAEATTQSATSLTTGNASTTTTEVAFRSETSTRPTTTTTSVTTRNPSTTEAILRTAETSRESLDTTTRKLGVEPQPGSTTSPETSKGFSSGSTALNSGTTKSNVASTESQPTPTTASEITTRFSTSSTMLNSGTAMSNATSTGTTEPQPGPTTLSELSTRFTSSTTLNSGSTMSIPSSPATTEKQPAPTTVSDLSTRFSTSSTTTTTNSSTAMPSATSTQTTEQQPRSTYTTDRILSSTAASISSTESRSPTDSKPTTVTPSQGNTTSLNSNSFQTSSTVTSSQGITSPNSNSTTVTSSQGSTSPNSFQTTSATPGQSLDSRTTTPNSIQTSSTTATITTTTTATTPATTTTPQSTDSPYGDGECVEDTAGFDDASKARASAGLTASNRRGKNGCILRQHKGGLCDRPEVRGAGGIGYTSHPYNCSRYIQCYPGTRGRMTAVTRVCGVGLFWNQESLRCDPAWIAPCFTDKCQQNISTRHYKMEGNNRRAFWYCQDGYSVPACCARGQGYFEGQGCVACSYCKEGCPSDWRRLRSASACDRRADPTSPTDYYMEFGVLGWMPATCSSGFFDLSKCTCSKDRLSLTDCTPHFFMSFDGRGNITYSNGQATTDNVVAANGYGIFMGDARVSVPMTFADILSRKAERPLRVNFQFMTSLIEGEGQVLVQSSPCVFGGLLVVYVDNTAIHARIFTQQGELASTEVFTEGFNTTEWKNVQLRYSSSGFTMTVSSKQLTYSSFIEVPSYPSLSECGWTFGHPERLDHLTPLFGLLDNIEVSYC